jgi:hypothetical protein
VTWANEGLSAKNFSSESLSDISKDNKISALIRGPKLTRDEYRKLYIKLCQAGFISTTTPESYDALCDASIYEDFLEGLVPEKRVFEISDTDVQAKIASLEDWGTVFIRSERGSVAKFGNISDCIISKWDIFSIKGRIEKIRKHFPEAKSLIVRKFLPIMEISGSRAEGRFIVFNGKVSHMDYCEITDTEAALQYGIRQFVSAQEVAKRFQEGGISGDYFIDIAEIKGGGWFVVEVKPLLNGTIRSINLYASAIRENSSL